MFCVGYGALIRITSRLPRAAASPHGPWPKWGHAMTTISHVARGRRPTQADVARLAGVSQATVSYIFNDAPAIRIPEATRHRILAAIAELGYVAGSRGPQSSARARPIRSPASSLTSPTLSIPRFSVVSRTWPAARLRRPDLQHRRRSGARSARSALSPAGPGGRSHFRLVSPVGRRVCATCSTAVLRGSLSRRAKKRASGRSTISTSIVPRPLVPSSRILSSSGHRGLA